MTARRFSRLRQIFFALLLAFAQQQAVVHYVAHASADIAERRQDGDKTPDRLCAKCLAFAQLDHVCDAAAIAFEADRIPVSASVKPVAIDDPTPRLTFYRGRAPPPLS